MPLPLSRVRTAARLCAVLAVLLIAGGCTEPPQREIDQAQAAIEVAVSAGAERFASEALVSARTALMQSRDAVNQRDYRLALSHALDSREKAQNAARAAAEARTAFRKDVESSLATVTALHEKASAAIAGSKGLPRARLRRIKAAESKLSESVQEARAAVEAEQYDAAQTQLAGLTKELEALLADVQGPPPAQSSRPSR
jgi:hypothetical protein